MFIFSRIKFFILAHIAIIAISNTLVQYPFELLGFRTTWGAFSYPLIFVLTDLATRFLGQQQARAVIYAAMLPGLFCSYLVSNYATDANLFIYNALSLRIALASFFAYFLGQILDITIFQWLRQRRWWVAPTIANIFGNLFDTYCFFAFAFYHSAQNYLSSHWLEVATIDLMFKLMISLGSFVPLYGLILKIFDEKISQFGHAFDSSRQINCRARQE
jgi:uncharacterized integral membrane protein (TIGR00697 family)